MSKREEEAFAQARWGDEFWEEGLSTYRFLKEQGESPAKALKEADEYVEELFVAINFNHGFIDHED